MTHFFLNFRRVLYTGVKNFFRNGLLTVATTSIMTFTLVIVGTLLVMNVVLTGTIEFLEDHLDISVYFKPETSEEIVLDVKSDLEGLPEVTDVRYISKDEGLVNLLDSKNIEEKGTIQSGIEEIGTNPLGHTLNIQTVSPDQYDVVQDFLMQEEYRTDVSKISVKEDIIDQVNRYATMLRYAGIGLSLIFALLSILITFYAIKITIHNFRSEIEIMRLVGASTWFIRLPFMVEGVLYGIVAASITLALLYPTIHYVSEKIMISIPTLNLSEYFDSNAFFMVFFLLMVGTLIGGVSSTFAIRRYLKESEKSGKTKMKKVKAH